MNRHRYLPFLLGATLYCAAPSPAQNKKATNSAGAQRGGAKPAPLPLPLILGAGLGGILLGGALGYALRKPAPVADDSDAAPDPLFDQVAFPLATVDGREKIKTANPAFAHFFNAQDAVGRSLPDLIHPDDLARVRTSLHEVLGGDLEHFSRDCRFFRPDGALVYAALDIKKHGKSRKADAVLVSLSDTTKQMEAQSELEGARAAIGALYEVIAGDKSRDLDGKMRSLLSMGCGRFELPIGVLGRFSGDNFETLFVQSIDRRVRPAMSLPRGDKSPEAQLLGMPRYPTHSNWKKHPFIAHNEGTAYFGAPVVIGEELYGMLSFSSLEAREKPFSLEEAELLQLMADWVGSEIEREGARASLEAQQKQLVEVNAKLEMMATHDPLTEAKNRRAFNEKLAEEWSRATRYGTPLSLILMDVDKFKSYNDTFGHPAGDEVLKRVARVIMAGVRGTDFFARYGGEEFVVLLPNTDADGSMILAERLRQKLEAAPWKERAVTASLGVASITPTIKTERELTQAADDALYASKENGRNRVTHIRDVKTPDTTFTLAEQ
jgi:diguanylate cyclase (GGDEF)-like protein/PAS domain S-box-containing protein